MWQAYCQAGENVFSVSDLVCLITVGYHQELGKYAVLHDIIKETITKLKSGEYPPIPKEQYLVLLNALRKCCLEKGYIAESIDCIDEYLRLIDDDNVAKREYYSVLLFTTMYLPLSSQKTFALHKKYGEFFADVVPYRHDLAARREEIRRTGRKIRIGYISPDCRLNVAARFFIGLLQYADKEKFTVFMYSTTNKADFMTEEIKKAADCFVDVCGKTAQDTAAQIYADGIDILIDLAGHVSNNPLPILARKPAPVQMSGIGYLFTTGLGAVDYYITDPIVDPPGTHEQYFTERLLYLKSQFSLLFVTEGGAPASTGAPCLQNGFVTFGVFNRYSKITDEMATAWKAILDQVPKSRILLKGVAYHYEGMIDVAKNRFAKLGLDISRLDFESSTRIYMRRYLDVDIALDTYPYTGGGTTCDALYMGVPVVTLYGERRNTRFSLGILANIGLKHLAVDSYEKYIKMAVTIAKDTELLDTLHRNLRPMLLNSVVGHPDLYTKELETKFLEVLGLQVPSAENS